MNVKIKIPTSLKDITLKQYKKFLKIQDNEKDLNFLNAKMIEIFCNIDLRNVMLLKVQDSNEITTILTDLFEEKPKLVTNFQIGKVKYGFHPQLDDLTLGEYIDLDTFIGDWDNIEKAMNVLYRPILAKIKDKYSIDEYKLGKEVELLNMPMDAVISSVFFLWNLGIDLSKTMMNYLDKEETQALTQYLTSQPSGDGIAAFTASLKGTLQELKISLN